MNYFSHDISTLTFHSATPAESANVVAMEDYIARLRTAGKMTRRGFFFCYDPEGASVIDLRERRLERLRAQYS